MNVGALTGALPDKDQPMTEALIYTISEACAVARTGRTSLYKAIQRGELRAVKRGRRTMVLSDDLHRYLHELPALEVRS
jgi:excisionase family DNA binding protein